MSILFMCTDKNYLMITFNNIFLKLPDGRINPQNRVKFSEELEVLQQLCDFLPKTTALLQYKWHIDNNIYHIPRCNSCQNLTKWQKQKNKYSEYCSHKCHGTAAITLEKRKITILKNYGVPYISQNINVRSKQKETCIIKYGTESPLANNTIKNKIKTTNLEKYGVEFPVQNDAIKNKILNTNKKNYNGVHFSQQHIQAETLSRLEDKEWLVEQHHKNKLFLVEISNMLNVSTATVSKYFKYHNIKIEHFYSSSEQKELMLFLQNNNINFIGNDRTVLGNLEVDMLIKDKNLCIEYNGLYWHSELNGKDMNYHLRKLNLCNEKGFDLIQIFSNEWKYKQSIVKSRILNKLYMTSSIGARKCLIRELNTNETKKFLNDNHIQGYTNSSVQLGLEYDKEIVCVMTFGKSRYNNRFDYELLRFCNKINLSVTGGASKLFKYFIQKYEPINIISYADRRYSNGNLYKKLNFTFIHNSAPNYHYFKQNEDILHSRIQFQKHKLKNKLESFDQTKSEWENMQDNGYDRVWDCGNSVWGWSII